MTRRTLDERIEQQKQAVNKAKDHCDAEATKLEQRMNKQDKLQKKEGMKAIEDSDRSFEEILQPLRGGSFAGDPVDAER